MTTAREQAIQAIEEATGLPHGSCEAFVDAIPGHVHAQLAIDTGALAPIYDALYGAQIEQLYRLVSPEDET